MKDMLGGRTPAPSRSFIPEWLSMNMMAAGMFPTMALLMMGRDMRAMDPPRALFWAVMSVGVIVGFTTAYPVNVWLVARNMKHGLMTVRAHATADSPKAEGAMAGHSMAGHAMGSPMRWTATRPQIAAVALVTVVAPCSASSCAADGQPAAERGRHPGSDQCRRG